MNIFILRHAIALPYGTTGVSDEDRPLTERGRERMQKASRGIRELIDQFDLILSSPLVRARQTAQIVAEQFDCEDKLEFTDLLLPSGLAVELRKELSRRRSVQNVLLVGHEPMLSEFVAFMVDARGAILALKKGGMCCVEFNHDKSYERGELKWLLTPKMLRRLA